VINLPDKPLLEQVLRRIFHQNVDMINTSDALKTDPILEPHDSFPRLLTTDVCLLGQGMHKLPLRRNITPVIIYSNRRPRPDENVLDARIKPIRPVVQQDRIISAVFKRNRGVVREGVCRYWLIGISRRPCQSLLHDEIRDAAVRLLGVEGPAEVFVKI
jgi:hypothetical protein